MREPKLKENEPKIRKRCYCPLCLGNPNQTLLQFQYSKNQFVIIFKCLNPNCNLEFTFPISIEVLQQLQLQNRLKLINSQLTKDIEKTIKKGKKK